MAIEPFLPEYANYSATR